MANSPKRPPSRESEYEDVKPGAPPRPATEPEGAQGSSNSRQTKTDPATGKTNP
jgi:hypothetical protein